MSFMTPIELSAFSKKLANVQTEIPPLYTSTNLQRTAADYPFHCVQSETVQPEPALDYELKWSDLYDITRFQLEESGRCYASHYPYDLVLDVYRQVYYTYPENVRRAGGPISADHHSGIFYKDVKAAENEIDRINDSITK